MRVSALESIYTKKKSSLGFSFSSAGVPQEYYNIVRCYYAQLLARKRCGQGRGGARHSPQVCALCARASTRAHFTPHALTAQRVPPPRAAVQEGDEQDRAVRAPQHHHEEDRPRAAATSEWLRGSPCSGVAPAPTQEPTHTLSHSPTHAPTHSACRGR